MVGVLVLIVFIVVWVAVATAIKSARTSARRAHNSQVRCSLSVSSSRGASDLEATMRQGLRGAGLEEKGAFDGATFYKLDGQTQLELKVWEESGTSRAEVSLPTVRSSSGRQQKLNRVGSVLASVERQVRAFDPNANIR